MSQRRPSNALHLQDLSIAGFRGIKDLSIGRLGRVTLIAGRNGVGKTTVLDAVRVFATRGRHSVLSVLLRGRDELIAADDADEKMPAPDFAALFHGRSPGDVRIAIGPSNRHDQVMIEEVALEEVALSEEQSAFVERLLPEAAVDDSVQLLRVVFRGASHVLPVFSVVRDPYARRIFTTGSAGATRVLRRALDESDRAAGIACQSLGPGLLGNHEISRYWNAIALTDHEATAVEALSLVIGEQVRRVAVVGDDARYRGYGRTIVRLEGRSHPVPLKSLGDGAVRLFGVALALANSRNGFLVIDEAENGIHHSIQESFWRMVLRTARANNVQVLATTHSIDCVRGFAAASDEAEEIECALVRVVRRNGETWAVEYSEKNLVIAAEQGIEVR